MRLWSIPALFLSLSSIAQTAVAADQSTAVLTTERRWLAAIEKHDAATLATILAPTFVHITYRGQLVDRNAAIANVKKAMPYTQSVSDETVQFAGSAAVVHGINAISQSGHIVLRVRFTDVFVQRAGRWLAISAQETPIQ